jgi:hypothetical protein
VVESGAERAGQKGKRQSAIASPVTTGSIATSLSVSAWHDDHRRRQRRQIKGIWWAVTWPKEHCTIPIKRLLQREDDWLFPMSYIVSRTSPQYHLTASKIRWFMQITVGRQLKGLEFGGEVGKLLISGYLAQAVQRPRSKTTLCHQKQRRRPCPWIACPSRRVVRSLTENS